jgi:hypothetical protein
MDGVLLPPVDLVERLDLSANLLAGLGAFREFGGDFAVRYRGLSMSAPPQTALLRGKATTLLPSVKNGAGVWRAAGNLLPRAFCRLMKIKAQKSSLKLSATYPALSIG